MVAVAVAVAVAVVVGVVVGVVVAVAVAVAVGVAVAVVVGVAVGVVVVVAVAVGVVVVVAVGVVVENQIVMSAPYTGRIPLDASEADLLAFIRAKADEHGVDRFTVTTVGLIMAYAPDGTWECGATLAGAAAVKEATAELETKHEHESLQLIDERDKAEQFGSNLYYLITGRSPEWSNMFGYDEAIEDVDDAQRVLRESLKNAEAQLAAQTAALEKAQAVLDYIRLMLKINSWYPHDTFSMTRKAEDALAAIRLCDAATMSAAQQDGKEAGKL